ncbi:MULTISPECIES: AraC family transcriptional regulator [unclassified Oceanispirochaeta]|uniref:helix-turn-helix domain-containing protein n=1 Tax=unclassified Oceanispirochaeta TaxID=2635722 RepID=UPI000E09CF21|nr:MULTISPECIES: helix-turn-helix domain-containing protein [unclassified Oceanispirochaeta]MBF9018561.1 AraC family transcriptional regulator [Oceanispirochaeta sp. M2]NPD74969.1 AraC family transcriptional regulator [Oceanispirochaeta sp. M1]RDG29199.1 AraC family transcriptional regulator [Oceanispirochaeta sp. M1]
MDSIESYALLFSAIHGILLFIVLFFWKKNRAANKIFSILVLIVSFNFLNLYGSAHNSTAVLFDLIEIIPGFIIGPLIYIYVRILTNESDSFRIKDLLHFIPALLSLPLGVIIFNNSIIIITEDIQTFIYLGASMVATGKFRLSIEGYLSSINSKKLNWLAIILICLTIFRLYSISETILLSTRFAIPQSIDNLSLIIESLFIYLISYFVLSQREIFDNELIRELKEDKINQKVKLSDLFIERNYSKLVLLMEKDELYLQNAITLKQLADDMNIPAYQLSQLINCKTGSNFYSFINSYRIKRACFMIMDSDMKKTTILDIAFASGFNSKTAFNEVFKKVTHMTPTEYRKSSKSLLSDSGY